MTTPANTGPGPRSGDDTYDLIDDALAKLTDRHGAWLGDDLTAVTLLASLIDQAERCLPELVTNARLNGHTWDEIARALATSPDEARLRFDPRIPGRRPAMALRPLAPENPLRSTRESPSRHRRHTKRGAHETRDASHPPDRARVTAGVLFGLSCPIRG